MSRVPGRRHQTVEEFISLLQMIRVLDMQVYAGRQHLQAKSINEVYSRRPVLSEAA